MTPEVYEEVRQEVLGSPDSAVGAAIAFAICREKLAAMMIRVSIATGHGDTFDDLLRELEAALTERR